MNQDYMEIAEKSAVSFVFGKFFKTLDERPDIF